MKKEPKKVFKIIGHNGKEMIASEEHYKVIQKQSELADTFSDENSTNIVEKPLKKQFKKK